MPKEKSIELIDKLIDSINILLINLPKDLDTIWDKTPYGGPVYCKVFFLCRSMFRAYELLQDYQLDEWWKDDPSRLEKDELNLGTLLYVNQLTRDERTMKVAKFFEGKDTGKPFLKCIQDLNDNVCKDAGKIGIAIYLEQCYTVLANTLMDTYHTEHPGQKSLNMLRAKRIEPPKSCPPKRGDYTRTLLNFMNWIDMLSFNFNGSISVFDSLETFTCTVNNFSFELDNLLTDFILKHNDELVRKPRLKKETRKYDELLYEESRKTMTRLSQMCTEMKSKYNTSMALYLEDAHSMTEEGRETEEKKLEETENAIDAIKTFLFAFKIFQKFLKILAEGNDIRTFMERDSELKELINTDLKSIFYGEL